MSVTKNLKKPTINLYVLFLLYSIDPLQFIQVCHGINTITIAPQDTFRIPIIDDILVPKFDVDSPINPIDAFLLDVLPKFIGQIPNNINGTKSIYKKYAYEDDSNDDATKLNYTELIERSGFRFKMYDCVADDGYITTITRIINPLADQRKLRWPPVLMMHGGTIDPSAYLMASSIQHHPEIWPRTGKEAPFNSWNRSLAFTLSNNGFDVFLSETRGSNDKNRKHIKSRLMEELSFTSIGDFLFTNNVTLNELLDTVTKQWNYWSFTQDDIIAYEVKAQIDTVLEIAKTDKVSLFTYSLSTPISLGFLSIRPDYAEKVHGFISMAPIVSGEGTNSLVKMIFQHFCPYVPDTLGTMIFSNMITTEPMRDFLAFVSRPKTVRYSFVKMLSTFIMGPSAQYETLLELNVIGHLFRQLSFKEMKQMCQQMRSNKLQKFDYGPLKNKLLYNSTEPPLYDLSNLNIKNWIVVMAENDALATPQGVERLIELVNPKPIAKVIAPGFNHMDLMAGVEVDRYVNLPILKYLESVSSGKTYQGEYLAGASARSFNLQSYFLPPPAEIAKQTDQITSVISNLTSNFGKTNPLLEGINKNIERFLSALDINKLLPNLFNQNNNSNNYINNNKLDPSSAYQEQEEKQQTKKY